MQVYIQSVGDRLVIDEEIEVCVLGIEGERVRLGLDVPRGVPIERWDREGEDTPLVEQTRGRAEDKAGDDDQ